MERVLNAVTGMAKGEGSLRERLAWVASDVSVFPMQTVPEALRARYTEFLALIGSAEVPQAARNHPHYPKSVRAYYLPPKKVKRAVELLVSMLETLAYGLDDED
jgi:hypothetical protein